MSLDPGRRAVGIGIGWGDYHNLESREDLSEGMTSGAKYGGEMMKRPNSRWISNVRVIQGKTKTMRMIVTKIWGNNKKQVET